MTDEIHVPRRQFLAGSAVLLTGSFLTKQLLADATEKSSARDAKLPITKAVKLSMVKTKGSIEDKFKLVRDLGFDGIEMNGPPPEDRESVRAASERVGLPIHGVVNYDHWKKPLSHPDPDVRRACIESVKQSIRDSKFYGGTSVLLVPAIVDETMPYDLAYKRSQAGIREILPLAESLDIQLLIENVWNNFLLSPLEMARYLDSFKSKHIGSYFDVGNIVRIGWPEQWIRILGPRIKKLDIKEYSRKKRDEEGLWKGFKVEIGEGDCNWPAVRQALAEINYRGWATAEVPGGDKARLADIAARMDRVLALR